MHSPGRECETQLLIHSVNGVYVMYIYMPLAAEEWCWARVCTCAIKAMCAVHNHPLLRMQHSVINQLPDKLIHCLWLWCLHRRDICKMALAHTHALGHQQSTGDF